MRLSPWFLTILCSIVFAMSYRTYSQEIQTPLDSQGKIKIIDSNLEKKLGLFSGYSNFQEAQLFQIPDTTYALEIYYQPGDKIYKARLPMTMEEVQEFQKLVSQRMKDEVPRVTLDQDGRSKFIASMMGLSLGFYGWAVPVSLDVSDGKVALALYMLTSSAGFYLPFSATRDKPVTDASATLCLYGGTRGILHGIEFAFLFSDEPEEQGTIASGLVFSLAEAFAGYKLAGQNKYSAGTTEVIGVGGDFGVGFGFGTAHLVNFIEDENGRGIAGSVLLESGLGLLAGHWMASQQSYTRGDANVLGAAGLLGAYLPLAIVDMTANDQDKAYTAASMTGAIAGLSFGHHLVKGKDFSTGQGSLISLSQCAGGLLGLGLAYLIAPEDSDDSALFLTSSSVGAATGFWLMYRALENDASIQKKKLSVDIKLNPEGFLGLVLGKEKSIMQRLPYPMFTVNCSF